MLTSKVSKLRMHSVDLVLSYYSLAWERVILEGEKKTKKINGNFLLTELVELLRWQKFFHLKKLNIWPSSMMMMIIKKSRLKSADSTDFSEMKGFYVTENKIFLKSYDLIYRQYYWSLLLYGAVFEIFDPHYCLWTHSFVVKPLKL